MQVKEVIEKMNANDETKKSLVNVECAILDALAEALGQDKDSGAALEVLGMICGNGLGRIFYTVVACGAEDEKIAELKAVIVRKVADTLDHWEGIGMALRENLDEFKSDVEEALNEADKPDTMH
jgi:hypothetical protein